MATQASASALVAVVLLAACGSSEQTVQAERTSSSDSQLVVPQIPVDDTPRIELATFLAKFSPGEEGYLLQPPESLRKAVKQSTVVLVAEIEDILPAYTKAEDAAAGHTFPGLNYAYLRLKPTSILAGQLQPGLSTVDVALCCPDADKLASLKAALPSGQAIYFLRFAATAVAEESGHAPTVEDLHSYTLTHFATVFVQDSDHVRAPMLPDLPERSNAKTEGQGFKKLSDVAQRSREMSSPATGTPSPQ